MKKSNSIFKNHFIIILAFLFGLFASCNKQVMFDEGIGNLPYDAKVPKNKVLLVTIGGGRGDIMQHAAIPEIRSLLPSSLYSWDSYTGPETEEDDDDDWRILLTGKIPFEDEPNQQANLTLFSYLKNHDQSMVLHAHHRDQALVGILSKEDFTESELLNTDEEIKNAALASLKEDQIDGLFVNFSNVEDAGESGGYSANNQQYVDEIEQTDRYIGELLEFVRERETKNNEKWMIVVASNRGGGDRLSEQRNNFVLYRFLNRKETDIERPLTNIEYEGNFPYFESVGDTYRIAYTDHSIYKFNDETSFTLEFKVKTLGGTATDNPLISNKDWYSGYNQGWQVTLQDRESIRVNYKGRDGGRIDVNGPFVADNLWHHITVVFNRKGPISIYHNGKLYIESGNLTDNGPSFTDLPLVFGADGNKVYALGYGNASVNSYMSDFRIWNTVLDPEEIQKWTFASDLKGHPKYGNLIGYWKANERIAPDFPYLVDSSPQKVNLKVENELATTHMMDILNPSDIDPTTQVPNSVDLIPNVLIWMGVKMQKEWNLDGKIWIAN